MLIILILDVLKPNKIWVSSRTEKTLRIWKDYGVNSTLKNYEILENCDIIFLAVKPHILDEALQTCTSSVKIIFGKLFISVIVGIPLDVLIQVSKYFFYFEI